MTCPTHGTRLYGGPIAYQCAAGDGHEVRAVDLDHEYQPQAVTV
jgi:hypothetical protein